MKNPLNWTFVGVGLAVGVLATWQLNTSIPLPTNFPSDEYGAKEELIKSYLDEQNYLQSRIVTLREEIEEQQALVQLHTEQSSIALLEQLKKDVGLSEISGRGVEILLDDGANVVRDGLEITNSELVQAADIRDLINLLYSSNAEAVSVNQQRVIATSPIASVGTSLLINNSRVSPPLTIQAVGDTDLMLQYLLEAEERLSFYGRVLDGDIEFEVAIRDNIVLPIYNGDLRTEYSQLVE